MKEINGDKIYDPDFFDIYWPTIIKNSWVQITITPDENSMRKAYLINSDEFSNKKIILSDNAILDEESILCYLLWFDADKNSGVVTGLNVKSNYRNNDLGYFIGSLIRSWLAINENKSLLAPPIDQRVPFVNEMLKKWCIAYEDDFTEFLAEDGNYYKYSDWKEKFSN